MKKRFLATIMLSLLMLTVIVSGCTIDINNGDTSGELETHDKEPVTISDFSGEAIVISKEPEKIISCAPNITEIIYVLGKGDKLVGRTSFCDYPEEVSNVEIIGDMQQPNLEKIISLEPDLVFVASIFSKENYDQLINAGINVVFMDAEESFEEVYQMIEKMGICLYANDEAEALIKDMKNQVEAVKTAVKDKGRPKVYYVIDFGEYGDFTATGETFISTMIEMAGGDNIASDAQGWQYSIEKIVEKNPDIVICSKYYDIMDGLMNANGYKDLPAVREGRLYEIDNNKIDRQGPRLTEGLLDFAKIIHPECF